MSDFQTKYEYGKMSFYTNEELLEVINKMAEALLFYANPIGQIPEGMSFTDCELDLGHKAREALKLAEPYLRGK